MKISVENGGKLLYLPQPVIPFAESVFDSRTEIFLDSGSQFVMEDIFSCGRTAMNERFAFKSYRSRTAVHIDGKLAFLDNVKLLPNEADPSEIGFYEGHTHSGMMYTYNVEASGDICCTNAYKGKAFRILSDCAQSISEKFDSIIK